MPEIAFAKMHGLGNDFVVLDALAAPELAIDAGRARLLADRRLGIGADQVLMVGATKTAGEFSYRIWNADGGEVQQCGNGARSVFAYLQRQGHCQASARLRTDCGVIDVEEGRTGPRAYLATPSFASADVPLARDDADWHELEWQQQRLRFAAVNLGNPQAVFYVDEVDNAPVAELGADLNEDSLFPQGVCASFLQLGAEQGSARLRVYERGVGETPACGSAAAACGVVLMREQALQSVTLQVAGGQLLAGWAGGDAKAWVEGPVAHAFAGTIAIG